uniref:MazG nucleotide pyrophosphohydrolase domain-containing protein n=1 Tax=Mesomycoplasma ovipneumoniae TaxID=29562 RepID=UPI00311965F2
VYEELDELREVVEHNGSQERKEEELGDLLCSLINMGRLYGLQPDTALERTNQKFIRRFNFLEDRARQAGHSLKDLTLDEMEAYYQQAKDAE